MELAFAATDLPLSSAAPALGRAFVAQRLAEWDFSLLVDDALLVVSELVTNAVVHAMGGGECRLNLVRSARGLRIAVTDTSAATPSVPAADVHRPSGRGLSMIERVAREWGTEPHPTGKTVWAELGPVEADAPVGRRAEPPSPSAPQLSTAAD